jgi:hypothetical protein
MHKLTTLILFIIGFAYAAYGVYLWLDYRRFKKARSLGVKVGGSGYAEGNDRLHKFSAGDVVVSFSKPREVWEQSTSTTLLIVKVGKHHYLTKQWSDLVKDFCHTTDRFDTMNINLVDENFTLETEGQRQIRDGKNEAESSMTADKTEDAGGKTKISYQDDDQTSEIKSLWQILGVVGQPNFKAVAVVGAELKPGETRTIPKGAVIEVVDWKISGLPYSAVAKHEGPFGFETYSFVNVFSKRWVRVK